MESDIQKILDAARAMKAAFKLLEVRGVKSFAEAAGHEQAAIDRYNAVRSAANTFRWFEGVELSLLRAAFDSVYADEIKKMNIIARQAVT